MNSIMQGNTAEITVPIDDVDLSAVVDMELVFEQGNTRFEKRDEVVIDSEAGTITCPLTQKETMMFTPNEYVTYQARFSDGTTVTGTTKYSFYVEENIGRKEFDLG